MQNGNQPPSYEEIAATYARVSGSLLDKIKPSTPESVEFTMKIMRERMMEGIQSIEWLKKSPHNSRCDLACIFRVMYDLHIQFRYILLNPLKHSVNYANFSNVEKFIWLKLMEAGPATGYANLQQQPTWKQQRAELENIYNHVKSEFEYRDDKNKIKLRSHWYKGNLATLSQMRAMKRIRRDTALVLTLRARTKAVLNGLQGCQPVGISDPLYRSPQSICGALDMSLIDLPTKVRVTGRRLLHGNKKSTSTGGYWSSDRRSESTHYSFRLIGR